MASYSWTVRATTCKNCGRTGDTHDNAGSGSHTGKDKNNAKGQSKGKWVDVVQTSQPSEASLGAFLALFPFTDTDRN